MELLPDIKTKNKVTRHKPSPLSVSSLIVLSIYILILIVVLIWLLCFSLTNYEEDINVFGGDLNWLASPSWYFENYKVVFSKMNMDIGGQTVTLAQMFGNSLLFAIGSALCAAFCPCLTAYATSKFNYKFSKVIDVLVLVTLSLPIVGALPSSIKIVESLHLNNSFIGFWILAFGFPTMYYFVYKASFKSIPDSLSESARIDGANNFHIFFRINLPLVRTTFLSVFILMFVSYWNNYSTPLAFAPELPTVAYGFWFTVIRTTHLYLTEVAAGGVILMIPMIVLFIFANKFLMGNLTMGGVKE